MRPFMKREFMASMSFQLLSQVRDTKRLCLPGVRQEALIMLAYAVVDLTGFPCQACRVAFDVFVDWVTGPERG